LPPLLKLIMTTAEIATHSEAINLLSSMFLCKPSKEAVQNWKTALGEDASIVLRELKKAVFKINTSSEDEIEELVWDYTRLFIGPYKLPCPPWESVYTSPKKLMMQDAAEQVSNIYREMGLAIGSDDVMPDHIGAELNFLGVLFGKINDEPGKKDVCVGVMRKFLAEHLNQWTPRFLSDMEASADSAFYKSLAKATGAILQSIDGQCRLHFPKKEQLAFLK
jgi:TorA maturation chaperone TorD